MTNLTFAGCAYRNPSDLADAVVAAWLTADGSNADADIAQVLRDFDNVELAADIRGEWVISEAVTDADLISAVARFRAAR